MIGREDWPATVPTGYELIRWARERGADPALGLTQLDAHVLLVLATYANTSQPNKSPRWGQAWPSISTIAKDCGLKVSANGTSGTISRSLKRLEDAGLIFSEQAGRGHPARRELMWHWHKQPLHQRSAKAPDDDRDAKQATAPPQCTATAPVQSELPEHLTSLSSNPYRPDEATAIVQWLPHSTDEVAEADDPARVRAQITESMQTARAAA